MLDEADNSAVQSAAPSESCSWEGRSTVFSVQRAARMTWLERYEALSAENAVLADRFSKGTLDPRQLTQLQGNIDQIAFLLAVSREAGSPDPNLPIEDESPKQ